MVDAGGACTMSLVDKSRKLPKSMVETTVPESSGSAFNQRWMSSEAPDKTTHHYPKSNTTYQYQMSEMMTDILDKTMYTCTVCGIVYSTQPDLESHERTHCQGPKKYMCVVCHCESDNKENLRSHMETNHGHEYKFFCFECGRAFKSYPSLNNHDRLFHRSDAVCPVCDICGKIFPFESKLQAHMKKHSQDRPFVCPVCGKAYKHQQNLKDHITICPVPL